MTFVSSKHAVDGDQCLKTSYEVMDGQQRLNSIVDFYANRFALRGLEKWSELNGSRYGELPETLQRGLDRRRISVTVLLVGGTTERRAR